MGIYAFTPETTGVSDMPRGLLTHIRVRGQRWHHAACFGPKRHYRCDGTCIHTDALVARLTPLGRELTKILPFGDGAYVPKRYTDSPLRPLSIPAPTKPERSGGSTPNQSVADQPGER